MNLDMCYNCGCGLPDDDMGQGHAGVDPNGKSITNKTIDAAATSQGMTRKQALQEIVKLANKELGQNK